MSAISAAGSDRGHDGRIGFRTPILGSGLLEEAAADAAATCYAAEGLRDGLVVPRNGLVMKASKRFVIEIEREADGRWIAEIPALPGVLAYGTTRDEAIAKAKALALRVLAERLEHGESAGELEGLFEAA